MTRAQALKGTTAPKALQARLRLVTVPYYTPVGSRRVGQLVVLDLWEKELSTVFAELYRLRFPIARMEPIVRYGWSDEKSVSANNTSCFNYRKLVHKDALSWHALGCAIDINPRWNPCCIGERATQRGDVYNPKRPGTLVEGPVVDAFEKRGWHWGGRFVQKDWQHFERQILDEATLATLLPEG
jgi:hypothetical protein